MCLKVFELHDNDTTIRLPVGKLYPAIRRVRGPNSYEGPTRYGTYVLSYMALEVVAQAVPSRAKRNIRGRRLPLSVTQN